MSYLTDSYTKAPRAFTISGWSDCIKNTNFSIVGNFRKFCWHLETLEKNSSLKAAFCLHSQYNNSDILLLQMKPASYLWVVSTSVGHLE